MRNVDIIIANTNLDSFENMLVNNKKTFDDKFSSNFILVPDKFSLNAEKSVFDLLDIKSTFNIDVVSFNRLAYRVFEKENLNILSKRKGLILVNKILLENKDSLTTFNKLIGKAGLTENIYETIMQFKSSGILPQEVYTNDTQSHLSSKLSDIKIIYDKYENELNNGIVDEPYRLKMLSNKIKTSELVSESCFYIGMFDNFTFLQLNVIKELIKYAKNVTVAISSNTFQSNRDVFINENLQDIIDICKSNNFAYNIFNVKSRENNEKQHIKTNLFSIKKQDKISTNNIEILENKDITSEINNVCKLIKAYVNLKNFEYKDFNIAVGDLESNKIDIIKIFKQYDIPYYLETSSAFTTSPLIKFVMDLLSCYKNNFSKVKVLNLVQSPFIRFDSVTKQEFENYVNKYGIDFSLFFNTFKYEKDSSCYKDIESFRVYLCDIFKEIKNIFDKYNYSYEFSSTLVEIIKKLDFDKTVNELLKKNIDTEKAKNLISSFDKMQQLMQEIDSVFENQINFDIYYEMLKSMFETECFTNVPTSANCVYIADATDGYFYKEKCLFVLNAVEGVLPSYKTDCGIITDNEIDKLSSKNILCPSVKFLNKKQKNRIYNLLTNYNEKLFLSYSLNNSGVENLPSDIIKQFCEMFKISVSNSIYEIARNEFGDENVAKVMIGNRTNAIIENIASVQDKSKISLSDCLSDENLLQKFNRQIDYKINVPENLKNKSSISIIEKYNNCPFACFCQHILKIDKKQVSGMQVYDIGNILHAVAEQFVDILIKENFAIKQESVTPLACELVNNILNSETYSHLSINNLQKQSMQKESENLCKVILYQINNSMYKPTKTEYKFKDFKFSDELKLNGKIDRVDECDDYFNIIDYKTGKDVFSFEDIYVGKKLQLVVYAYIYSVLSGKKISGFYYMPISNKYASSDKDFYKKYKLLGISLNNDGVIKRIDKRLITEKESDIINIKFKNDGTLYTSSENNLLDYCDQVSLIDYSIDMIKNTSSEFLSGKINPLPLDSSCKYCPYYSVCGYDEKKSGTRQMPKKITKEFFRKEQEQ